MQKQLADGVVEAWVRETQGWFTTKEIDTDLEILTASGKASRKVILSRLFKKGIIERHPTVNGRYRLIDNSAAVLEWENADVGNTVNLILPFGLHKLVSIYPKNEMVIAGDPNSGKTALLLNVIALNMNEFPIIYFTSEMGAEELKVRLSRFEHIGKWNFEARERTSNFAQVIKPDYVNIIDYLEQTDNFYLVAEELNDIWNKLKNGVAIIAIQKKQGARLGRGAEFSLEKPRLYLSMGNGTLEIIKAKNWAQEGINPNGRRWKFNLIQGCKFVNIQEQWSG